ncbi:MAG: carboxypeptidase regulatory-like domain-containing protein, partial [Bryobacteraceae bacterium]
TTYGAPSKPKKIFNTFGGALSGPVLIPKLYNGHDRTFFFIDYEGNREPQTTLQQGSVPSASVRSGNLNGLPGPAVLDPATGAPFPNNVIPADRINPVAAKVLSTYYPLPNYNSTVTNYRNLLSTPSSTDGYDIRIDHVINSKQQVFGRWSWKNIPYTQSNGAILPPDQYTISSRNLILSHNFSILPTLVNEFRFGISRWTTADRFPLNGSSVVASLGLQGLDLSGVPAGTGGFPQFNFSDGTGFTAVSHGRDGPTRSENYQFVDNVSWNKGRHAMKFGFDIRQLRYEAVLHYSSSDDFGGFTFSSGAFSGNAFADFLLGLPSSSLYVTEGANTNQKITNYDFYAQDEWLVSDHLTVSYGLRYEIHPPMSEASGNISNFNPANLEVVVPDKHVPNAPGFLDSVNLCPGTVPGYPCTNIVTASQAGLPQGLRRTYYGNFDPRLSLAYR